MGELVLEDLSFAYKVEKTVVNDGHDLPTAASYVLVPFHCVVQVVDRLRGRNGSYVHNHDVSRFKLLTESAKEP